MIPGWIKLVVLTASVATILGACTHFHGHNRRQDMIDRPGKCTLSPSALSERKARFEASLGLKTLDIKELDDGFAIRFPTDSQTVQAVFDFVAAERRCCGSFVTFEVILNHGEGPFWLRLRGDKEAKEFLEEILNLDAKLPTGDS